MKPLTSRVDRYPAKMVSRLAAEILEKHAGDAESVLDPFCGSGAILVAAQARNVPVLGVDLNPYAVLLSKVKLSGFLGGSAIDLCHNVVASARKTGPLFPINWPQKSYWFSSGVIKKIERLRFELTRTNLDNPEGRALLLALALSVRFCSRADQRSPKPFISKSAISQKRGRHIDPFPLVENMLGELATYYGQPRNLGATVVRFDLSDGRRLVDFAGLHSHAITSPPYINAQDYFRNFKLELYILEGLLAFSVDEIRERFIGTERGLGRTWLEGDEARLRESLAPELKTIARKDLHLASVVHRYLHDMRAAFSAVIECIKPGGKLVIVCGDNLVAGVRVRTWQTINKVLEHIGFSWIESYGDPILCRTLAPRRQGHKGLIKEEIVSVFCRP